MRRAALVLCVAGLCACGGGNVASELAKPPDYNPDDQTKCKVKASQEQPLIVEWPSADRTRLESKAQAQIVVVSYNGCEMKLLPHCTAPGTYSYRGVAPKEDTVSIRNEDELYASIPIYAAKFESKLASAGELNIAMTIVGQMETNKPTVNVSELNGRCDGATHIISGLTVGAFEFFAGADAEVGAGVDVAGAGVGAKSKAQRETLTKEGKAEACQQEGDFTRTPPPGCTGLLRVEVLPLATAQAPRAVPPVATAQASGAADCASVGAKWNGSNCVCPAGSRWKGSQCVRPVAAGSGAAPPAATAGACKKGDLATCTSRCNDGDAQSCRNLARMYYNGQGGLTNDAEAARLLKKACDGGYMADCSLLGRLYRAGRGVARNQAEAARLQKMACDGGDLSGCYLLGNAYLHGEGVTENAAEAARLYMKTCDAGFAPGCNGLANPYGEKKKRAANNHAEAVIFHAKACKMGLKASCDAAKRLRGK